jgi:nucleotide-binding universal stress UspA family protein
MSLSTAPLPWNRLLVTTDFSTDSLTAWRHAKAIAAVQPVAITVLHVTEPPFEGLRIHTENLHEEMRTQAESRIRDLAKSHFPQAGEVTPRVEHGRPASKICQIAKEEGADLILIASHGRSGIQHVLLGSVAADVVRHAPCPVMVVPVAAK